MLGKIGRDKVTGFEGVIIGKCEYLTGCNQYGLVPRAIEGKLGDTAWFDEGRIEIIGDGISVVSVAAQKKGGPNRDCPR